jgi:1,2-diacylglycerol 3-beta-glucosyltransferase
MTWLDVALSVAGIPVLASAAYLAALATMARRQTAPTGSAPQLRFDLVVPAHDEETEITATVESLLAVRYPSALFRVVVIADNCTDQTGARAAAAGARVLVRDDTARRGKGFALAYAFDWSVSDGFADAVIVVDADTVVSPNLLSAFAARFGAGAAVLQAEYGVRNPLSSWRTRLMTIALSAFHGVRSLARERLGLSCGLRGNGMGFSNAVLRSVPPKAFSIVEDLEYGLELGRAGIRVEYAGEARVFGQMVVTEAASRSQRQRWESGRRAILRSQGWPLFLAALRRRDLLLLDLVIDLLIPPLGELVALTATGAGLCVFLRSVHGGLAPWIWGSSGVALVAYVLRGWALSEVGARGLLDLLWAPLYVLWKITLWIRHRGQRPIDWVRTTREVRM